MESATVFTHLEAVFCFPPEPNIPEEPEYTISMYGEKFYQLHAAQRQLLRPLHDMDKVLLENRRTPLPVPRF